MTIRNTLVAVTLGALAMLGVFGGGVLGAEDEAAVVEEELQRKELASADGQQAMMVRARLAPGASMAEDPVIEHPGEEFVYVAGGSATLTRAGEEPIQFGAGDSWYNEPEASHTVANASTTDPLILVAVVIGDADAF